MNPLILSSQLSQKCVNPFMKTYKYVEDGCKPSDARTLDELFGKKKVLNVPYKSKAELETALKAMNLLDIQSLAIKMGIRPTSDRPRLVRACLDQYSRLVKTYGLAKQPTEDLFDPKSL